MPRLVVLGTGTGVGKTWVGVTLAAALKRQGLHVLGLKPIETGVPRERDSGEPAQPLHLSDASLLAQSSDVPTPRQHPLLAFEAPISPHLAARRAERVIELDAIRAWVRASERAATAELHDNTSRVWSLVETAGGVFSPLSDERDNFDLAVALSPALWLLVAPDALGVLHDVRATLTAMQARGRLPDALALSTARVPDASTGSNAQELRRLGVIDPLVSFGPSQSEPADWLDRLLALAAT